MPTRVILITLVPSEAPQSITGHATGPTSVHVAWLPPHDESTYGILLGYQVFFKKAQDPGYTYWLKKVEWPQQFIDLTNLEEGVSYCIEVAGFTRKGTGKWSQCLELATNRPSEGW